MEITNAETQLFEAVRQRDDAKAHMILQTFYADQRRRMRESLSATLVLLVEVDNDGPLLDPDTYKLTLPDGIRVQLTGAKK